MNIENIKKSFSGKYEFIKLLGKGGFAEVYLALDKMLERKVAIKILLPKHASDPDIVKRFIREARLYAKLEHPNLINIYETGIAEGTAFIVMKYVKGKNLKSYIEEDKRTRLALVPGIINALSSALTYIHNKGIIHRDIKPANIIIEDGGENIYLADFGIARSASSQTMTQTGSIMGTPYYISPEQIKGGNVDHRSDIYALGATLYELVTGKPVFSADSSIEILYKHVNEEPEQIGKIIPEAPRDLKYIISKCLEKKPGKRFQNASEISKILTEKKGVLMGKRLSYAASEKKQKKRGPVLIILSIVIIPLIAFAIYKGTSGYRDSTSDELQNRDKNSNIISKDVPEIKKEVETSNAATITRSEEKVRDKKSLISGISKNKIEEIVPVKEQNILPRKKTDKIRKDQKVVTGKEKNEITTNLPGTIRFSSYPPAEIYWNGLKLGNTTQIFKKSFPPGKYKFTYKIEGYLSEDKEILVEPGKEVSSHHRFSPYGFLTITARPFAKFFINEIDYGDNPIFEKKFPVGTYRIRAEKKGYISEERIIRIISMKKTNINFSLKMEATK